MRRRGRAARTAQWSRVMSRQKALDCIVQPVGSQPPLGRYPLSGLGDDVLRLEDGIDVARRSPGVVRRNDEHLAPDAHGRKLSGERFEQPEGRPGRAWRLHACQGVGVYEDAAVGERRRRAHQCAGVHPAVGGHEPPAGQESCRNDAPVGHGQAGVEAEICSAAPASKASDRRSPVGTGSSATIAGRAPADALSNSDTNRATQRSASWRWRRHCQAATDLRGHSAQRPARRLHGAVRRRYGGVLVVCLLVMVHRT